MNEAVIGKMLHALSHLSADGNLEGEKMGGGGAW